jgi:DNA-binding NarL/FixJ family response regulator
MTVDVLLVDDHALVRAGFSMILATEDDLRVVGEAADGAQAVQQVRALSPDVVLMDVQMPGTDGIAATAEITASTDARVVMVTTFDREDYLFASLRAGASGFLLKNGEPEDLVDAVRAVAAGHALLAPAVTRRVIERFATTRADDGHAARLAELTERERDILAAVARGLSNAEIAGQLFVSEATVKTHVSRLLAKLGVRDRVQAVVLAYESGFVQRGA